MPSTVYMFRLIVVLFCSFQLKIYLSSKSLCSFDGETANLKKWSNKLNNYLLLSIRIEKYDMEMKVNEGFERDNGNIASI